MSAACAEDWMVTPLSQQDAARVLGVSDRAFFDILKELHARGVETHEARGRKRVFYPENILNIRTALKCKEQHETAGKTAKRKTPGTRIGSRNQVTGQSTSSLKDSGFATALAFAQRK